MPHPTCDRRRFLAAFAGLALVGLPRPARAWIPWRQEGSVRIVVPFAAGGGTDTLARILAHELAILIGRPVYVDNISGGGARRGILQFLATATDGNSLLLGGNGTHAAAKALFDDAGYDPEEDFSPVGLIAETPAVLVARRGLARDYGDLVRVLREQGPAIKLAHSGPCTGSHAAALAIISELRIAPTLVTYDGGGPALNDVISGEADLLIDQIVNIVDAAAMHRVDAHVISGSKRSNALPGVPPAREVGLRFPAESWSALFAARTTPPEQVQELNALVRAALEQPRFRNRLFDLGAEIPASDRRSPEALALLVKNDIERWKSADLRGSRL